MYAWCFIFFLHINVTIISVKRWPVNVATSSADPGRWIGQADGLDHASSGLFAKKILEL
jgi:hypothetical protein